MNIKSKELIYVSLCSVIIIICSWISIPMAIPFTLQTFGIFLTLKILGGKLGTLSILIYIFLGILGLPVFAGFKSGFAALAGPTGGYIVGFILTSLVIWIFENLFYKNKLGFFLLSIFSLILCYIFGTLWFVKVFIGPNGSINFTSALKMCVIPFVIPDLIKIFFAYFIGEKVSKTLKIDNK